MPARHHRLPDDPHHPAGTSHTAPNAYVERPEPTVDFTNRQAISGTAAVSIARKSFARSHSFTLYTMAQTPGLEAALQVTDPVGAQELLWLLATLRFGLGNVSHTLNFDLPLNRMVAIPLAASEVDVSVKLIAPTHQVFFGAFNINQATRMLSDPPQLAGSFVNGIKFPSGPPNVTAYLSETPVSREDLDVPVRFNQFGLNGGVTGSVVIPFGTRSVQVIANNNVSTCEMFDPLFLASWGFIPVNGDAVLLPPNIVRLAITNHAAPGLGAEYTVIYYLGI